MSNLKHKYTDAEAPMNTGSINRPARFNLRLTCSARARTMKVIEEARAAFQPPYKEYSGADVWEKYLLPLCEHAVWQLRNGNRSARLFVASMFTNLDPEDTVRSTFKRLNERLNGRKGGKGGKAKSRAR